MNNPFIVQQIPELSNRIMENLESWEDLAKFQLENYHGDENDKRDFDFLIELAQLYGHDAIDTMNEGFVCPKDGCGKVAVQRCSRCKCEWYCSKSCQVSLFFGFTRIG